MLAEALLEADALAEGERDALTDALILGLSDADTEAEKLKDADALALDEADGDKDLEADALDEADALLLAEAEGDKEAEALLLADLEALALDEALGLKDAETDELPVGAGAKEAAIIFQLTFPAPSVSQVILYAPAGVIAALLSPIPKTLV